MAHEQINGIQQQNYVTQREKGGVEWHGSNIQLLPTLAMVGASWPLKLMPLRKTSDTDLVSATAHCPKAVW